MYFLNNIIIETTVKLREKPNQLYTFMIIIKECCLYCAGETYEAVNPSSNKFNESLRGSHVNSVVHNKTVVHHLWGLFSIMQQ